MRAFRSLVSRALLAGVVAGLALFALQWVFMLPLIQEAERYEHAAAHADHADHAPDETAAWQPADGVERNAYTALGTTLTGVGNAVTLFGAVALLGSSLNGRRAWWFALAGFACFALAPALGLPPRPPGAAVPELRAAQTWWLATAVATAAGLWLLAGREASWPRRGVGMLCLLAPHLIGAPMVHGADALPSTLKWQFVSASVGTQAMFWLLLGGVGRLTFRHEDAGVA